MQLSMNKVEKIRVKNMFRQQNGINGQSVIFLAGGIIHKNFHSLT
jgi:hypothetical protein